MQRQLIISSIYHNLKQNKVFVNYDNLDTCADCGEVLTENEKNENIDTCHKCFDKAFDDD